MAPLTASRVRVDDYYHDGLSLFRVAALWADGAQIDLEDCFTNRIDPLVPVSRLDGLELLRRGTLAGAE
jgi:hypothetical protein